MSRSPRSANPCRWSRCFPRGVGRGADVSSCAPSIRYPLVVGGPDAGYCLHQRRFAGAVIADEGRRPRRRRRRSRRRSAHRRPERRRRRVRPAVPHRAGHASSCWRGIHCHGVKPLHAIRKIRRPAVTPVSFAGAPGPGAAGPRRRGAGRSPRRGAHLKPAARLRDPCMPLSAARTRSSRRGAAGTRAAWRAPERVGDGAGLDEYGGSRRTILSRSAALGHELRGSGSGGSSHSTTAPPTSQPSARGTSGS